MVEPADDERNLGGMGIVSIVGRAEIGRTAPVTVHVADDMPARLAGGGPVNEARRRRFIDLRKMHGEFGRRLVPQDEGRSLVGQGGTEMVQDDGEMLSWDPAAAQFGLGVAYAAIREMGGERWRQRRIKRQPGTTQYEHRTIASHGEPVSGPTAAKRIEPRRSAHGRNRIAGNGGEQRGCGRIIGEHGHLPVAAATNRPTVIASAVGRACR